MSAMKKALVPIETAKNASGSIANIHFGSFTLQSSLCFLDNTLNTKSTVAAIQKNPTPADIRVNAPITSVVHEILISVQGQSTDIIKSKAAKSLKKSDISIVESTKNDLSSACCVRTRSRRFLDFLRLGVYFISRMFRPYFQIQYAKIAL